MIIDTDALREGIASHYDAFTVTDSEICTDPRALIRQREQMADRLEAVNRLGLAERVANRFSGPPPDAAGQLLARLYAFVCAHTGDGNATGISLEHPANSADALRLEFEATFKAQATEHGVRLDHLTADHERSA